MITIRYLWFLPPGERVGLLLHDANIHADSIVLVSVSEWVNDRPILEIGPQGRRLYRGTRLTVENISPAEGHVNVSLSVKARPPGQELLVMADYVIIEPPALTWVGFPYGAIGFPGSIVSTEVEDSKGKRIPRKPSKRKPPKKIREIQKQAHEKLAASVWGSVVAIESTSEAPEKRKGARKK